METVHGCKQICFFRDLPFAKYVLQISAAFHQSLQDIDRAPTTPDGGPSFVSVILLPP